MNRHTLFMAALLTSVCGALPIAACASSDESNSSPQEDNNEITIVGSDANTGPNAADDVDAGPCTGCEWFPAECTPKIPCNGGPFDPSTAGGPIDGRVRINVIRGRSASDVWAVGARGTVAHFDGSSWTRLDIGDEWTNQAIWLRDDTELLLTSLQRFHTHAADAGLSSWFSIDLTNASDSPVPSSLLQQPYQLTSAWAARGATWLWCTSFDNWDLFGGGGSTAQMMPDLWRLRYTTAKFQGLEVAEALPSGSCGEIPCSRMNAVHGFDKNELWAVGSKGVTIHVTDADSDTPHAVAFNSLTQNELRGVWSASATDAWSVGAQGTIRHYVGDPLHWDVVADVPVSSNLNAVWGTSPSDVWAVGDDAVVLHYDGSRWSRVPVAGLGARRPKLTTVWTPSPGHVWIGGEGVVLSIGEKDPK